MRFCSRILVMFFAWTGLGQSSPLWGQPDARPATAPLRRIVVSSVKPAETGAMVLRHGLTREDFNRIQKLNEIKNGAPVREALHNVSVGERSVSAVITGTTPRYARLHSLAQERGRFLSDKDGKQLNNVAVLNGPAARSLFADEDPIGENVRIGRSYYLVVGVVTTGGAPPANEETPPDPRSRVYIPLATMRSRMGDQTLVREAGQLSLERYELSRIELDVSPRKAEVVAEQIQQMLRRSHSPESYRVDILTADAAPADNRKDEQ